MVLTWSENCVIASKATRVADPDADPGVDAFINLANATFNLTDTKLYVLAVTLSTDDDNKLLEQLTTGFRRTIK